MSEEGQHGQHVIIYVINNFYTYLFTGPSRRFRRVCEHLQHLILGPRGDALCQRKVSTDSTSSYTSETGDSPRHSSSTKENADEEVKNNQFQKYLRITYIILCYLQVHVIVGNITEY